MIKAKEKKTLEGQIADRVIEAMKADRLPPWEQGWSYHPSEVARDAFIGKPYRGVNILLTEMARRVKGYRDPRWLTYEEAQRIGRQVRKGEKSTTLIYWTSPEIEEVVVDAEGNKKKLAPLARRYNAFNVEQTDGEKPLKQITPREELTREEAAETAEEIIARWKNKPEIKIEKGTVCPRYYPALDQILVPDISRYKDVRKYYISLFHELVHSTCHESRMNWPMADIESDQHGYGREEMLAGIGTAMLAGRAGFKEFQIERDAAYVDHWRQAIDADPPSVIYAAQQAQKACDMILDEKPQIAR